MREPEKTARQMAKEYAENERRKSALLSLFSHFFLLHWKTFFAIALTCVVFVILWQRYRILKTEEAKNEQNSISTQISAPPAAISSQMPTPYISTNIAPDFFENLANPSRTPAPSINPVRNLSGTPKPNQQISPDTIRKLNSQ